MVEQSFWEMLRTKRDSLTKSGIIVADYLLQHAEDAQYLSISSPVSYTHLPLPTKLDV